MNLGRIKTQAIGKQWLNGLLTLHYEGYRVDQKKRTPLSYIPLISLFSADFLKFSASNRQHDTSIKLWCPESVVFTIL